MTVAVPEPIPLEMPPGDPAALEDFVEDVAGTGYRLAVVATCLSSSSASAPNWRSADASAAAAQVAVVARLADDLAGVVAAAAQRLRAHHDHLVLTRRRIATLRAQQDEDFAVARAQLLEIPDFLTGVRPEAAAVAEELEAAEAARRAEYDRLLAELADDAAAAAQVLADACRRVGGTGRREDSELVVAHLAAQLPGWGDAELRRMGGVLAQALIGCPLTPEETDAAALDAVPFAGSAEFARGLLAGLGVEGVRGLIAALGYGRLGPSSDVARVLAGAFGAAATSNRLGDPVREVLTAVYVAPDDRYGDSDVAAVGLAVLLQAGSASGPGAVRSETAARWAGQLLHRERAQGVVAGAGAWPAGLDPRALDPVELALEAVVAGGDAGPAAGLLAHRGIWDLALARFWGDSGEALSGVVALAGAPGPAGDRVVRLGLEALGAGLSETGDPADWTVRHEVAAAVARSLAGAVVCHLSVATDVLQTAAAGAELDRTEDDALRGLGYLTLDRDAARLIESALLDRVRIPLLVVDGAGSGANLPAVRVAGAYGAVQEYGQRLAHAIQAFEAQDAAERAETWWNWTWGLAANLVLGRLGPVAGLVEGYGAIWAGADGTWPNEQDDGLRIDREAIARRLRTQVGADLEAAAVELGEQSSTAYDRTAQSLGTPRGPISAQPDYLEPLLEAVVGAAAGRATDAAEKNVAAVYRQAEELISDYGTGQRRVRRTLGP